MKALVGVIVQPVVEPMDRFTALMRMATRGRAARCGNILATAATAAAGEATVRSGVFTMPAVRCGSAPLPLPWVVWIARGSSGEMGTDTLRTVTPAPAAVMGRSVPVCVARDSVLQSITPMAARTVRGTCGRRGRGTRMTATTAPVTAPN